MAPSEFRHIETFRGAGLTVHKYVLTNGLVLLHQLQPQSPVLSYQTWFDVGSRDDGPGMSGRAHLFEHLMFLGTHDSPAGEYDRLVESRGGQVNAATWLDWTYYDVDVPTNLFEDVVALEADRMNGLALSQDAFEAEREIVLNERREQVDDDPDGLLGEALWALVFGGHPYGAPTIGHLDHIRGLTLDKCLDLYGERYAPNHAVICLSGGVPLDHALQTIGRAYGHIPAAKPTLGPQHAPASYPVATAQRSVLELPLAGERLLMGFALPPISDSRAPALEVLNELLMEGDSSILYRRCVSEGELATTAYGDLSLLSLGGLYELGIDLRPGVSAERAEDIVVEVLESFAREPVSSRGLKRACNQLETRAYRNLQTAHQRAGALGFWETTGGDFKGAFRAAEQYRRVTAEDLMKVCSELLEPNGRQVVLGRGP